MPVYKTKVSKGNRHVALGSIPDYATGLMWSITVNNDPDHFGSAITGSSPCAELDAYIAMYDAENEDANGMLPHQYRDLTVVPAPVDIVLPDVAAAA